jgi:hypothetical protein
VASDRRGAAIRSAQRRIRSLGEAVAIKFKSRRARRAVVRNAAARPSGLARFDRNAAGSLAFRFVDVTLPTARRRRSSRADPAGGSKAPPKTGYSGALAVSHCRRRWIG